jgi:hypothetical protein
MFAIAVSYTDSRGNDKVKAYMESGDSKHEALGKVFMTMTRTIVGDFVLKGWDIAPDEDSLVAVIRPELEAGRFIAAIKALRAHTGWGLKESKAFCDRYRYSF